jgi:hypothetical protein
LSAIPTAPNLREWISPKSWSLILDSGDGDTAYARLGGDLDHAAVQAIGEELVRG